MRPVRFVSANDYIMFQTSDQCHQVATQSFALKRWKARGPILGRYSLHTHSFLNRKEGTHLVLSYVGKSFLVQNIENKSYSSLAVKLNDTRRKGASSSVIHCDLDCFIFDLSVWLNLRIPGICFYEWYRYSLDRRPQLPGLKDTTRLFVNLLCVLKR